MSPLLLYIYSVTWSNNVYGVCRYCSLNSLTENKYLDFIDNIAAKYRITCVRKFGSTWIGCLGFFRSYDEDNRNCYQSILFLCELMSMSKAFSGKVSYALEFGTIIGKGLICLMPLLFQVF